MHFETPLITGNWQAWRDADMPPVDDHLTFERTLDEARDCGVRNLVFNYLPPKERGELDYYRGLAEKLNVAAQKCHRAGAKLWYHNHNFEFARKTGGRPIDVLLSRLDFQLSEEKRQLVGDRRVIFKGTPIGLTEAPHLYKRNGYYYLITAEGGTGWGHAVTMARSRQLDGPYELHPDTYILTARHRPDIELQRAGHADLVETQSGDTYLVHLCGRPLRNRGRCTLGRETAIQRMAWSDDGWLWTADGECVPRVRAVLVLQSLHISNGDLHRLPGRDVGHRLSEDVGGSGNL